MTVAGNRNDGALCSHVLCTNLCILHHAYPHVHTIHAAGLLALHKVKMPQKEKKKSTFVNASWEAQK